MVEKRRVCNLVSQDECVILDTVRMPLDEKNPASGPNSADKTHTRNTHMGR